MGGQWQLPRQPPSRRRAKMKHLKNCRAKREQLTRCQANREVPQNCRAKREQLENAAQKRSISKAAERRGNNLQGFRYFHQKVRTKSSPGCLDCAKLLRRGCQHSEGKWTRSSPSRRCTFHFFICFCIMFVKILLHIDDAIQIMRSITISYIILNTNKNQCIVPVSSS